MGIHGENGHARCLRGVKEATASFSRQNYEYAFEILRADNKSTVLSLFIVLVRYSVDTADIDPVVPIFLEPIFGRLRIASDFVRIRNRNTIFHLEYTSRTGL